MITREESGFSQEVYDQLKTHLGSVSVEFKVRRRNLDFSLHSVYTDRGKLWDASVADDLIRRAYIASGVLYVTDLANEDSQAQTWTDAVAVASGVSDVPPSLFENDTLFYMKSSYVCRATYDGNSWTLNENWAPAPSGTVDYIAAGNATTCHVASWRTDYNTGFFTALPGEITESGILIPHRITGFSAINGPEDAEFNTTTQIIAVSLDLPVQIGTSAKGSQVEHIAYRSNGILSFLYQHGTWSDHFFVERFDDASNWQYRKHVKLSALPNGRWCLTAFGKDGYEGDPHDSLHYYFTGNGKFWELPWLFRTSGISYGGKLLVNGKYAYMVSSSITSRSYATELVTNNIPTEIIENITNRVSSYESSITNGRQTAILLRNEDDWYTSSILSEPGVYSLITKWGIGPHRQQVAHEIVEVCSPAKDTPAREVVLKARDFMSLLDTHVRSPHPRIFDTQVVGADEYNDITGTTYGGLQHTAGILGSWSTEDGWLLARRNNTRSLAYKTFKIDIWNGSIQAKVNPQIAKPNKPNQYIGLVWRGYDKDNYYSFEYHITKRELRLNEMRAGEKKQILPAITGINWIRVSRYMRVRFRYSHVICEYSTDGLTWTTAFDTVLPGREPVETGDQPVVIEEGQVGLTARGFAAGDMYVTDPYNYGDVEPVDPSIPEEDVDYEGAPDKETGGEEEPGEPEGEELADTTTNVFVFTSTNVHSVRLEEDPELTNFYTTTNFLDDPPTWSAKTMPGLRDNTLSWLNESYLWYNYPLDACVDPFSPAFVGTGTEIDAWVLTHPPVVVDSGGRTYFDTYGSVKIYKVTDIFGTPVSALKYTVPPHNTSRNYLAAGKIVASSLVKNHVVAALVPDVPTTGNRNTIVVSTVDGVSWQRYVFPLDHDGEGSSQFPALNLELSKVVPGRVWVTANENTGTYLRGKLYRSDSYGEEFTKVLDQFVFDLHIPENNSNGGSSIGEYAYCSIYTGTTVQFARLDGSGLTNIQPETYDLAPFDMVNGYTAFDPTFYQWMHTHGSITSFPGDRNIIAAIVRRWDTGASKHWWTVAISTNGGEDWSIPEWEVDYTIDKIRFSADNSQTIFAALGSVKYSNTFHRSENRGVVFLDWENKYITMYGGWGPGSE